MSFVLSSELRVKITEHALAEYPKECCGLISDELYFPAINAAIDPTKDFVIPVGMQVQLRQAGRRIDAVVHSHPDGTAYPSEPDMRGQMATKLPWIIVRTNGQVVDSIETWGDGVDVAPLIGRTFMHGIRDCYSLVRDAYALGAEGMKAQGVDIAWPLPPIALPDFARMDCWWDEKNSGQTLYVDNFFKAGFSRITREQARAGDGFLVKIQSKTPNHAAVLLSDGQILHHIPSRFSRRDPSSPWAHSADTWLRYEGPK